VVFCQGALPLAFEDPSPNYKAAAGFSVRVAFP